MIQLYILAYFGPEDPEGCKQWVYNPQLMWPV
jgi:hypothetical protein